MVSYEWTPEGYQRVLAQGLDPAEVHEALSGPGPRLLEAVSDDMLAVVGRASAGKLIEVWLRENPDDGARELFAAFEAGMLGKAKWINAFGQEE